MALELSFAYAVHSILMKKCHVGQCIQPVQNEPDSVSRFCFVLIVTGTGSATAPWERRNTSLEKSV